MIKENKIKKYVVVIICLLGMLILSGKTENVFANDKKSKDMENSLLSFYIKDVSNVESIKYIPLDKKIIGNKRITDKSNVVDIGFGEYYIKAKDEKKELQEPSYSSWYEAPKGGMQFREKLSIEYQVNKDYNNKNLRILKKVVEENIHPKNKVLISASQYVNVKNEYKKNIKACIFYQSYSIQLYEKDLFFENNYGVSAGACHLCSYLAKQYKRAFRVNVDYLNDKRYCSVHSLLKTGNLFGAEMLYDIIPNELDLFDYDTYNKNESNFYVVITDINTGKPEYVKIGDLKKDIIYVRASSSLPLLAQNVKINDKEYLDGGISDSIPIKKSIADGNKKNVVILTRDSTYRKGKNSLMPIIKLKYKK